MPAFKPISALFRPIRSALAWICGVGLFCLAAQAPAQSERAGGDRPRIGLERIDEAEGRKRMAAFRNQRLAGDFCFRFELAHKPYRSSRTIRYEGTMWGSWNEAGPVTRYELIPLREGAPSEAAPPVELIVHGGREPAVWSRRGDSDAFEQLEGAALFEPVFDGVVFRPFDLQMPFVYWEDYRYEGPGRIGSYAALQNFMMRPPEDSAAAQMGLGGVRLGIDDDYNALRRIEVLDTEAGVVSEFVAQGFRKIEDQWIVSRITIKDLRSRDATTFKVESAALDVDLDPGCFDPESGISPEVRSSAFEDV
ncbi:MAG: hypothetical protein ACLFVC_07050 [Opitutales bacterium]